MVVWLEVRFEMRFMDDAICEGPVKASPITMARSHQNAQLVLLL